MSEDINQLILKIQTGNRKAFPDKVALNGKIENRYLILQMFRTWKD